MTLYEAWLEEKKAGTKYTNWGEYRAAAICPKAEAPEAAEIDLTAMTVGELRNYAEKHGIDLGDAKKKADIINVIREGEK